MGCLIIMSRFTYVNTPAHTANTRHTYEKRPQNIMFHERLPLRAARHRATAQSVPTLILGIQNIVNNDGFVAAGTNTDIGNTATRQFFQPLQIILGLLRQIGH